VKKRKLFILLSIVTIICIFAVAASCNLCGVPVNEGDTGIGSSADNTEVVNQTTAENTDRAQDTSAEESTEQVEGETIQDEPLEAPVISIFIYEGPLYSVADDVCYYRVASEVYGNPYPEVTWSKDDSGGALGWDKVQVNLHRGETYKLTATATNSVDTVTTSLTLTWGCGEGQVPEDTQVAATTVSEGSEAQVKIADLAPVYGESGTLFQDIEFGIDRLRFMVGDDSRNKNVRIFLSFNISSLRGADILDAVLIMDKPIKAGDPSFFNEFWIQEIYWGQNLPSNEQFGSPGFLITKYPGNFNGRIIHKSQTLIDYIQSDLDAQKTRFQIRLSFIGNVLSDNDNMSDIYKYSDPFVRLQIKYTNSN